MEFFDVSSYFTLTNSGLPKAGKYRFTLCQVLLKKPHNRHFESLNKQDFGMIGQDEKLQKDAKESYRIFKVKI